MHPLWNFAAHKPFEIPPKREWNGPFERRALVKFYLFIIAETTTTTAFTNVSSTNTSPEKTSFHNGLEPEPSTTMDGAISPGGGGGGGGGRSATTKATTAKHQSRSGGRKKIAADSKREKKAAKTLLIITGAFVVCWLPFFIIAILLPVCAAHQNWCNINDYLVAFFQWLGYVLISFFLFLITIALKGRGIGEESVLPLSVKQVGKCNLTYKPMLISGTSIRPWTRWSTRFFRRNFVTPSRSCCAAGVKADGPSDAGDSVRDTTWCNDPTSLTQQQLLLLKLLKLHFLHLALWIRLRSKSASKKYKPPPPHQSKVATPKWTVQN